MACRFQKKSVPISRLKHLYQTVWTFSVRNAVSPRYRWTQKSPLAMCLLPRLQQIQLKQYKITSAIKTSEQIRRQPLGTCSSPWAGKMLVLILAKLSTYGKFRRLKRWLQMNNKLRICCQRAELQAVYFCSTRGKVMPIQNLEFKKLWQ